MGAQEVIEQIRRTLAERCSSRRSRRVLFSSAAPTDWRPSSLRNPSREAEYFTEDSAWEFIAQNLLSGCSIDTIVLQMPAGKLGYVLLVPGVLPVQLIYIKLQMGSDVVIGRSFHESYVSL